MPIKFTEDQQKVIDLRNRNLLVSAAAGSGKTAVLVERICQMVMDKNNPLDIDRLLVVTYTKLAAAEMKERIKNSLTDLSVKNPQNTHIRKQLALIYSANITTIDSFCLDFLKEHFYELPLEPGFRTLDDNEGKLMKKEVLNDTLRAFYEEQDPEFMDLLSNYVTGKTDEDLIGYIEALDKQSMANPYPEQWLDDCLSLYDVEKEFQENSTLTKLILDDANSKIKDFIAYDEQALRIFEESGLEKQRSFVETEIEKLEEFLTITDLESYFRAAINFDFGTFPRKPKDESLLVMHEEGKSYREKGKGLLSDMKKSGYFSLSFEERKKEFEYIAKYVKVLIRITKQFQQNFKNRKIEENVLDFSDMEHYALELLYDENHELTSIAKQYKSRYQEIMIDEYQDSNMLQESILNAISTCDQGKNNIFMVGDKKQSIYGFRNAEPSLFINKYDTYTLENSENQKVVLNVNYRSRKEVLQFSNYIFKGLMKKYFGGIEYDELEALNYSNSYKNDDLPEAGKLNPDYTTEVLLMDKNNIKDMNEDANSDELTGICEENEAHMMALIIKKIMSTCHVYSAKTQEKRPVRFGDIAILLRKKKHVKPILDVLKEYDIPASFKENQEYFDQVEVSVMLSLLRLIDNEMQDVPLAAILSSPIVGLTNVELGEIKGAVLKEYDNYSFVETVNLYYEMEEMKNSSIHEKLQIFYEKLASWKKASTYLSVHELLDLLYRESGYYEYVGLLPMGDVRRKNLDLLLKKARDYENSSYHGLYHFLKYMENIEKMDLEIESKKTESNDNMVTIMSIHGSKGLEFPFVILGQIGKVYNEMELRNNYLVHSLYGMGLDYQNYEDHIRRHSLLFHVMKNCKKYEDLAEEIRILYVALTRAKEKLFITGITDKIEEKAFPFESDNFLYSDLLRAKSIADFLLPFVLRLDEKKSNLCSLKIYTPEQLENEKETSKMEEDLNRADYLRGILDQSLIDSKKDNALFEAFHQGYYHEKELSLKNKMSVSEIKHQFMKQYYEQLKDEEGEEESFISPEFLREEKEGVIPRFLNPEEKPKENVGALRGSATHRVMELLDYTAQDLMPVSNLTSEERRKILQERLQGMISSGRLKKEELALVQPDKVLGFLNHPVAERMHIAACKKALKKEQPFVMGISPKQAGLDFDSEDQILVQGIIDVFFEEEDGFVLLDYKTDAVSTPEELANRYQKQMELYASAIERSYNKKVKEVILYSFSLQCAVDIPLKSTL